ncbi:hypothetical protein ABIA54_000997 [Pseudomonas sp. EB276 TE3739]|nr:hypothetical protein [Pseudomonas koreensis]
MNIKPIRSPEDLSAALLRMEQLWVQKSTRRMAMSWKFSLC